MTVSSHEDVSHMTPLLVLTSSESVAHRVCQVLRTTYPGNKSRRIEKAQKS
jgi:hypothetical protein